MQAVRRPTPLTQEIRRWLERALVSISADDRKKTISEIEKHDSCRWASATFEGHRHTITVRIDGPAAVVDAASASFRTAIACDDIRLPGELLADMEVVGEECVASGNHVAKRLYLEALTVMD